MKIAIVFDGLQIGGIERVGSDYIRLLRELGHEVTVINLVPRLNEMEYLVPEGVRIEHFPYPRWLCPERYNKLIRMHDWGKYAYPVLSLGLSLMNVVYRLYSRLFSFLCTRYDLAIAFSGHFNDLTFLSLGYVRSEKKLCWLHGALYSYLLSSDGFISLYRKIGNLVVLVDEAEEEILAYNPFLRLNITKMYNPVCIGRRKVDEGEAELLKRKYGVFILMVSRFSYPHKDQYTVAEAFSLVREKYGDDIDLVFVGDGEEEEKVKNYVSSSLSSVSSHIHFEGARNNVQDYYSSAKILVHASVAGEGLPTVIPEAFSYGLPVVVTDSKTGPREILGDNEYGLLSRIRDPRDMAEKIHRLLSDDSLYALYRKKGLERLSSFSPDRIRTELSSLLERIR